MAYPELDDRYIFVISRKQGGLQLYFVVDGVWLREETVCLIYENDGPCRLFVDVLDASPRRAYLLESEKARAQP